jgi:hypothetical protein
MAHRFGARSRLVATAVAVTLTVTAAPLALAGGAAADPADRTRALEQADSARHGGTAAVPLLPKRSKVRGGGPSGFLTVPTGSENLNWTSYADGTTKSLGTDGRSADSPVLGALSDTVVVPPRGTSRVTTLIDATTGTRTEIDLAALGDRYRYVAAVGSTLLVSDDSPSAAHRLRLVARTGGTVSDRGVTGLPAGISIATAAASAGTAAIGYVTPDHKSGLAVIDLAEAEVTDTYPLDRYAEREIAVSDTHAAWVEPRLSDRPAAIVVADRRTDETRRLTLPEGRYANEVGLLGGWLVYATNDDDWVYEGDNSPLAVVPLDTLTGSRDILDEASGIVPGPDGALLVTGGDEHDGRGIYRLTAGSGGPALERLASTGEPSALTFLGEDIPAEINLDRGQHALTWRFNRYRAHFTVTLRHRATGKQRSWELDPHAAGNEQPTELDFHWDGDLGAEHFPEYGPDGAYDWSLTAEPWNGIGETLTRSGGIVVKRTPGRHDLTVNGSPDLIGRDSAGRLWRQDTYLRGWGPRPELQGVARKQIGHGWQKYDRIEAVGNNGSGTGFVARDRSGVLWSYRSKATGELTPAARVGGGWNVYTRFSGGGDLTGDRRPDLVAVDTKGDLWLYRGTGTDAPLFKARERIGWGWGIYNEITAVGHIAGGAAGDLVARDRAGVLWLHQGLGNGKFGPRTRIGGGWNTFTRLVGIGDANRDGRPDLYAYSPGSGSSFYAGTGDAKSPFKARSATAVLAGDGDYNQVS